jgi:predicted nucleic acid-binding Zn ribbon protein
MGMCDLGAHTAIDRSGATGGERIGPLSAPRFVSLTWLTHQGATSLVRLCSTCGMAAEAVCERCGLPVCGQHRPRADQRCAECEASYRRRRPVRMLFYLASLVSASVALVLALFFLVIATGGGALGVAPLILFGSFPVILHWLENRARAHFLAQRHPGVAALPRARLLH